MILPFKEQFVIPILDCTKIHTIREDKTNRWKAGNVIHGATGVRTKNYNQFFEDVCRSTQKIEIKYDNKCSDWPAVIIDGKEHRIYHKPNVILQLAMNDGFKHPSEFSEWFKSDFKGKIIHWTDFKY